MADQVIREGEILRLEKLSLGYNKTIYSNINAVAVVSEMIGVVGANGTGKSTLLRSVSGILPYRSGKIELLGKRIEKYKGSKLASFVSFVPSQSPRARNFSLEDMLATSCYGRTNWIGNISREDQQIIQESVAKVGLDGYQKRDISTLSDGEFQRAAIARSLVQDSRIILLDEPTAFLDIANKIVIAKLLRNICNNEQKTIIFSTHDLQQAIKMCDRIWIMGYDRFFEGPPKELIEKGAFEHMFKDSSLKFDKSLFTFV
jgi:iron complex transport system ATP-binding protein